MKWNRVIRRDGGLKVGAAHAVGQISWRARTEKE